MGASSGSNQVSKMILSLVLVIGLASGLVFSQHEPDGEDPVDSEEEVTTIRI